MKSFLPPEHFELRGLTMIRALDVTESEVLSLLQRDLIDQESITSWNGFQQVQDRLRTLFQNPDLICDIAALNEGQVLLTASQIKPMLLVHELIHRIEGFLARISTGLDTGDDLSVIDFLSREVEPLFPMLQGHDPGIQNAVDKYYAAQDPMVGTVYRLRRDFENSIAVLNDRLCSYLEQEEAELQRLVSHYFERHKTDGLDYLMY